MGEETTWDKIKVVIGYIGWKIFLWSIGMTSREYIKAIYEQEKALEGEDV